MEVQFYAARVMKTVKLKKRIFFYQEEDIYNIIFLSSGYLEINIIEIEFLLRNCFHFSEIIENFLKIK